MGSNNRIVVLFDPTTWTKAATTTLGTLTLNQDLVLNQDYHLIVQPMDDTTTGAVVKSDGKLTITNDATLTVNAGGTVKATSVALNNGNLEVNTDMSFGTHCR